MKMHNISSKVLAIFIAVIGFSIYALAIDWDNLPPDKAVQDELLVIFKKKVPVLDRLAAHAAMNVELKNSFWSIPCDCVKIPAGMTLKEAAKTYLSHPDVAYVEPNYIVHALAVPNDALFSQLWGMIRANATQAWDVTTGGTNVVVAVIDTGIRRTHEDLAGNMWTNPGEIPGNGIDDDGNGYIDDVYGWDFYNNDNDPTDDHGHGTHVAGTIGGVGNNTVGVAGVNWKTQIVAIKFLGASGSGTIAGAISSVEYARKLKAYVRLTNNSWGGGGYSAALYAAIEGAKADGQLFIAAAGNAGNDNDASPTYPASYPCDNIIAVASIDPGGGLSSFSNYGATSVDIGAPGRNIMSCLATADNAYGQMSGTSMATPHVSGAAALLWNFFPALTWSEVKSAILDSARPNSALTGKVLTGGELDIGAMFRSKVTPSDGLISVGLAGVGPFTPASKTYEIWNISATNETWNISVNQPWVDVSPVSVTLAPMTKTNVVVSINANALLLPPGTYNAIVSFVNQTTGIGSTTRIVTLRAYSSTYIVSSTKFDWIDPVSNNFACLPLRDDMTSEQIIDWMKHVSISLPFPVQYFTDVYTNCYISANGMLGFLRPGLEAWVNQDIPSPVEPNGMLCPLWDDLIGRDNIFWSWAGIPMGWHPGLVGNIYYGTVGPVSNRSFVVTWDYVSHAYDDSARYSFQVVIKETTNSDSNPIIFQYLEVSEDNMSYGCGRSATIGLEDPMGMIGARYSYNGSSWVANRQAIMFTQLPQVDLERPSGSIRVYKATDSSVTFAVRFNEIISDMGIPAVTLHGPPVSPNPAPGATVSAVQGGGELYLVEVTGISGLGTVAISIQPDAVHDIAGNGNELVGPCVYVMPALVTNFVDDMEGGPGDWTRSDKDYEYVLSDIWEYGSPDPGYAAGPASAYSGTNCWGTKLAGPCNWRGAVVKAWLKSPVIYAERNPTLSFATWYNISRYYMGIDYRFLCWVEVLGTNGWQIVREYWAPSSSGNWQKEQIELDDKMFGNQPLQIRFVAWQVGGPGMYIDDVAVVSRRNPGLWVINYSTTPAALGPGQSGTLNLTLYNSTTNTYSDVTAHIHTASAGVTIGPPADVSYGTLAPGRVVVRSIPVSIGGLGQLDGPKVTLFHHIRDAGGESWSQPIELTLNGVPSTLGTNELTVTTTIGVKDWMGRFLYGDGGPTSCLFQVIWAGPDGKIDPPAKNGATTGDDKLLYAKGSGLSEGRFGEGTGVTPNSGKFLKTFRHSLTTNDYIYIRAWDAPSFDGAIAYGESWLYRIKLTSNETYDSGYWLVDKAIDPTRDFNGDSIPDGYCVSNRMDARELIRPLAPGLILKKVIGTAGTDPGKFSQPYGVAITEKYLFVADTGNNRIQTFDRTNHNFVATYGVKGTAPGEFGQPRGIAIDPRAGANRIAVADTGNDRVQMLSYNPDTGEITGVLWVKDGYESVSGVAIGSDGRIYLAVAGTSIGGGQLVMLDSNGNQLSTIANLGSSMPRGVCLSSSGDVITTGTRRHVIYGYSTGGTLLWTVGVDGSNGTDNLMFNMPQGVQVGVGGRIYVADTDNNRIQIMTSARSHIATVGQFGYDPGYLNKPGNLMPAQDGNLLYVADTMNNRVQLFWTVFDADGDGMDDIWEETHGLNSADPSDALVDSDGDGVLNIGEYRLWMQGVPCHPGRADNPLNLRITAFHVPSALNNNSAGEVTLSWYAVEGGVYQIEYTTNLIAPQWNVGKVVTAQSTGVITVTTSLPQSDRCFYRIKRIK
jgi:sugar lactone lactonase YvrE